MQDWLQENYRLDKKYVWVSKKGHFFDYSDGEEVENRILAGVESAEDISLASDELQGCISDWPSEYHFSPLRANLLEPFSLESVQSVLEIGSGCGAVTRLLGEKGKQVFALEGSKRRAAISRSRCRDLNNVTVCCDSFDTFHCPARFDCVTLIGVLEYAPAFMSGDDPFQTLLKKAEQLLNKNGLLIIGIENLLGLKYFNGCTEDHSGLPFTGINDQYPPARFRTFGRVQLQNMLNAAGFSSLYFVYPFPDYKMPRILVRDEALRSDILDLGSIISQYRSRDYAFEGDRIFHERRAWPLLEKNKLIRDLANSFLIFASPERIDPQRLTGDWLIKTYSCQRKKVYLTNNAFVARNNTIHVEKKLLYPSSVKVNQDNSTKIRLVVAEEPYLPGKLYTEAMQSCFHSGDLQAAYAAYLSPWVQYLLDNLNSNKQNEQTLPGDYFDCLPANLIITGNSDLVRFDQEWQYEGELPLGFILFRGIYRDIKTHLDELEEAGLFAEQSVFHLMQQIFIQHDLKLDEQMLAQYIALEVDLQLDLIIYPVAKKELVAYLSDFLFQKRSTRQSLGRFLAEGGLQKHAILQQENQAIAGQLEALQQELATTRSCWSWKIGRFLTYLPRLLRRQLRTKLDS